MACANSSPCVLSLISEISSLHTKETIKMKVQKYVTNYIPKSSQIPSSQQMLMEHYFLYFNAEKTNVKFAPEQKNLFPWGLF